MPAWLLPLLADAAVNFGMYQLARHDAGNAQQRQVSDMERAGRNPMWMGSGSGASVVSPPSVNVAQDFGVGLQREQQKYTILEKRAIVQEILARAGRETNESKRLADLRDLQVLLAKKEVELKDLDVETKRAMLPFVADLARAELGQRLSSARQTSAMALLEELRVNGALNDAQWQELIGVSGPMGRVLMELAKTVGIGAILMGR